MKIIRTARFVCFTLFLLAAGLPATAQVGFADAEALALKAFLQQNFGNTNAAGTGSSGPQGDERC